MRCYLAIVALGSAALVLSPVAMAQAPKTNPPPADTGGVPGANSFTEAQAKARLEKEGYTEVSGLKKDDKGVWRGTAMKGGKRVNVGVDYQGNITAS